MLKRIEITNFESHKHTVIEDLSDGLNLFRGESNAGKTSIVRALKLAAYNDFDPKSVRTGETKCEVFVETDKGTVKVIRGPKINYWEVHPKGENLQTFDKVGKQVVPEAARVMGLNIVRLGDTDIPVNIMDQLESHFMLASVGGQDASGSMRAQVIDEISGLSGIEGVIKAVSLDNHRFGREIKENELKMKEAQDQMHDTRILAQEQVTLQTAETELTSYSDCLKASEEASKLLEKYNTIAEQAKVAEDALAAIPDFEAAKVELDKADELMDKANQADAIYTAAITTQEDIYTAEEKIRAIPDVADALKSLKQAEQAIEMAKKAEKLLTDYQKIAERTAELNATVETIEQMGDPSKHLQAAQVALEALKKAEAMLTAAKTLQGQISALEGRLEANAKALKKAEADRDVILSQIKVCPVTLGAISPECLQKGKV